MEASVKIPENIVRHFIYSADISLRIIDFRPAKTLVKETYENGGLGKHEERKRQNGLVTTVYAGVVPHKGKWTKIGEASDRDPQKAADLAWRKAIHHLVERSMISRQNIDKIMVNLETNRCEKVLYYGYKESGGLCPQ